MVHYPEGVIEGLNGNLAAKVNLASSSEKEKKGFTDCKTFSAKMRILPHFEEHSFGRGYLLHEANPFVQPRNNLRRHNTECSGDFPLHLFSLLFYKDKTSYKRKCMCETI